MEIKLIGILFIVMLRHFMFMEEKNIFSNNTNTNIKIYYIIMDYHKNERVKWFIFI